MEIRPGERLIGGLAVLVLLAGCWSAALAQVGPCAGAVEYTGIEGVGSAEVLAIDNHRMVTSDGATVSNWRLGDPSSPEFLGRWTLWDEKYWSVRRMEVDERGFAYLGFEVGVSYPPWYSVRIWDLREGREPRPVTVLPGSWTDFFVDRGLFVGIAAGVGDLVIIDVSDPTDPNVLCTNCGGISLDHGPPSYGHEHIRIENLAGRAVILDFSVLLVVEYTDPSSPVLLATLPLASPVVGVDTVLWANDALAVAGPTSLGEIAIADLHDPATPSLTSFDFDPIWDVEWGAFHGDTLIIRDPESPAALRLDLSNPSTPAELSPIVFSFWPGSSAVWNDRLYVEGEGVVHVYDLQGNPTQIGIGPRDRYADRIAVADGIGLAIGGRTLFTYDLIAPDAPLEMANLELDWSPRLPATDGLLGAVMRYGAGVVLVDLRSLSNPVILDTVPVWGTTVSAIEIGDGLLSVVSGNDSGTSWLELWEVGFSTAPVFLARLERDESVWRTERSGNRIFLGLEGAVVEVDITDPANPTAGSAVNLQNLAFPITGLAAAGNELFAVDGYRITVVDTSTPGSPVERDIVNDELAGVNIWLASDGETVVAGDNGGPIHVIGSPDSGGLLPVIGVDPPRIWSHAGGVWDGRLYLAQQYKLTTMDLTCAPFEADFTWYSMGTQVRFIDRTAFYVWDINRQWQWTVGGDPEVYSSRSPLIEFPDVGSYQVTVEVTSTTGSVTATKTVEVSPNPSRLLIFTDGFEFRSTDAWSSTQPQQPTASSSFGSSLNFVLPRLGPSQDSRF